MASAPAPAPQLSPLAAAIAAYKRGDFVDAAHLLIQSHYPQIDWTRFRLDQITPLRDHYCLEMPGLHIDIWSGQGGTIKFMWPHQTRSLPIEGMCFHIQTGHCGAHQYYSFRIEHREEANTDSGDEDEGVSLF